MYNFGAKKLKLEIIHKTMHNRQQKSDSALHQRKWPHYIKETRKKEGKKEIL
jgi:hypothetical protein